MLLRVVRQLAKVAEPVVVVAAEGQLLPVLPSGVAVARDVRPAAGPLEGIRVGLEALASKVDRAFVASCDAPLLVPQFVRAVADRLGAADVAVPCDEHHAHCLAGVYRVSVAPVIDALLEQGIRRPIALFDQVPSRRIDVDELRHADPDLTSLRNVNTPEAYQALLRQFDFSD